MGLFLLHIFSHGPVIGSPDKFLLNTGKIVQKIIEAEVDAVFLQRGFSLASGRLLSRSSL